MSCVVFACQRVSRVRHLVQPLHFSTWELVVCEGGSCLLSLRLNGKSKLYREMFSTRTWICHWNIVLFTDHWCNLGYEYKTLDKLMFQIPETLSNREKQLILTWIRADRGCNVQQVNLHSLTDVCLHSNCVTSLADCTFEKEIVVETRAVFRLCNFLRRVFASCSGFLFVWCVFCDHNRTFLPWGTAAAVLLIVSF